MSILIKEVHPLANKESVDGIVSVVRSILKQPGIVRLVVDARKDNIDYWRAVSDDEAGEKSISIHDALRQTTMEEYNPYQDNNDGDGKPGTDKLPFEQLFDMFEMIEDAGCVPSHIVFGGGPVQLRKWIDISRKAKMIFGVPITFDAQVESDVLIVCGSTEREATAADMEYAVKLTLP